MRARSVRSFISVQIAGLRNELSTLSNGSGRKPGDGLRVLPADLAPSRLAPSRLASPRLASPRLASPRAQGKRDSPSSDPLAEAATLRRYLALSFQYRRAGVGRGRVGSAAALRVTRRPYPAFRQRPVPITCTY